MLFRSPLLRLADIYLMAAEAQLRGGTGLSRAEALELVNQVRLRAYNQDESGKISDNDFTLDFILDERARELYLESVRRTDLIRFNKFVSADYYFLHFLSRRAGEHIYMFAFLRFAQSAAVGLQLRRGRGNTHCRRAAGASGDLKGARNADLYS